MCDSADYFYKDCNSYVIELGLVKEKQQQTAESADSSSISATVTAQELIDLIEYSTNTSDDQGMQELKEQGQTKSFIAYRQYVNISTTSCVFPKRQFIHSLGHFFSPYKQYIQINYYWV